MGIAYTATLVVITDDRNPDRAPLLLPADTPPADVSAAVAAYIGPVSEPDWPQFRKALRTENSFSAAFSAAMAADPMGSVALVVAFDAFRREGDFAGFIDALRDVMTVLPHEQANSTGKGILALAKQCNLSDQFIKALAQLVAD